MHPSVIICLPGFSKIKSILFKMVSELSFASASGLFSVIFGVCCLFEVMGEQS